MSKKAIRKEAELLETKAWAVAKKMGYERTADNAAKFGQVIDRFLDAGWAIFDSADRSTHSDEFRPGYREKTIALVMFAAAAYRDDYSEYGSEDDAWGCVGSAFFALGKIEGRIESEKGEPEDEESGLASFFSAAGKKGAQKRHAPNTALREWTIKRYRDGEWKSANQAAHALKDAVMEHGRTIGALLSEENAQRTIAEWIRKSVKPLG